jgi:hypothetical protein
MTLLDLGKISKRQWAKIQGWQGGTTIFFFVLMILPIVAIRIFEFVPVALEILPFWFVCIGAVISLYQIVKGISYLPWMWSEFGAQRLNSAAAEGGPLE